MEKPNFCVVRDFQIYFIYFLIYYIHPRGNRVSWKVSALSTTTNGRVKKIKLKFLCQPKVEFRYRKSGNPLRYHLCRSAMILILDSRCCKIQRHDNERLENVPNNGEEFWVSFVEYLNIFVALTTATGNWHECSLLTEDFRIPLTIRSCVSFIHSKFPFSHVWEAKVFIWIIKTLGIFMNFTIFLVENRTTERRHIKLSKVMRLSREVKFIVIIIHFNSVEIPFPFSFLSISCNSTSPSH